MHCFESLFAIRLGQRRLTTLLGAAALLLLANGCSPPPRTVEVVGRVTYKGAPVEGAVVIFYAEKYPDDLPAAGRTDAEGRYELRTYFSASDIPLGALPNDYVVCIQKLKVPDIRRAQDKMSVLARRGGDVMRYIAEKAVQDLWPDGVPEGWPDGYIPTVTPIPRRVMENEQLLEKLERLSQGIPLLPRHYGSPSTSELRAAVGWSDEPLTFDFDLTGEIEDSALQAGAEHWLGPQG